METNLAAQEQRCLQLRFGGPGGLTSYRDVAAALGTTEFVARRTERLALRKLRLSAIVEMGDLGQTPTTDPRAVESEANARTTDFQKEGA